MSKRSLSATFCKNKNEECRSVYAWDWSNSIYITLGIISWIHILLIAETLGNV